MIIQLKKLKGGGVKLFEKGKSLVVLTREQAKTLSVALEIASR